MKRNCFFVVILFVVLTFAFAQTENDFKVALTADYTGAAITGYTGQGISALRIPETLQGFPVKEIGNHVFYDNSTITSVTFPSTIEKIGDEAFFKCRNLQVVTIPANVTRIEFVTRVVPARFNYISHNSENFGGCNLLLSSQAALKQRGYHEKFYSKKIGNYEVILTDDYKGLKILEAKFNVVYAVTSQRQHFYERAQIPDVVIPTSIEGMVVKEIGSSSFKYSESLNSEGHVRTTDSNSTYVPCITNSVTIPEEVEYIGEKAFSSNLFRSVVFPTNSKLRIIGNSAFSYCKQLSSVTLPSTLRIIGNSAFSDCEQLSSVMIPEGVTEIGSTAFSECKSLTSIDLPSTVIKIGVQAFRGCSNLSSITIPDTIEIIGNGAFQGTKLPLSIQAELRRKGYKGDF